MLIGTIIKSDDDDCSGWVFLLLIFSLVVVSVVCLASKTAKLVKIETEKNTCALIKTTLCC